MIRRFILVVGFGASISGLLGCSPAPNSSDPTVGREALQKALQAWQKGDSLDAYKQTAPTVTVVEKAWADGTKLVAFEIAAEAVPDGYDAQFKAKLDVKDASGKQSTQKAVYNVSTTPALVIVRIAQ